MSTNTESSGAGGAAHGSGTVFVSSATSLIRVIAKSPGASILFFGAVIVLLSLFRKIGNFESQLTGSSTRALVIGIGFLAIGIFWTAAAVWANRRRLQEIAPDRKLPPEAYDLDFMMKVFYNAMPPAFVKRLDSEPSSDGRLAEEILFSKPFLRFQDSPDTVDVSARDNTRYARIRQDHRAGDERAVSDGMSIQLEYPASYINGELRPILTHKCRITHRKKSYIVGWYIPIDLDVDLDKIPPDAERLHLCEEIDQVKLRLSFEEDQNRALTVELGQAVRDAFRPTGG